MPAEGARIEDMNSLKEETTPDVDRARVDRSGWSRSCRCLSRPSGWPGVRASSRTWGWGGRAGRRPTLSTSKAERAAWPDAQDAVG